MTKIKNHFFAVGFELQPGCAPGGCQQWVESIAMHFPPSKTNLNQLRCTSTKLQHINSPAICNRQISWFIAANWIHNRSGSSEDVFCVHGNGAKKKHEKGNQKIGWLLQETACWLDWFGVSERSNKQFSITKRSPGDGVTIDPATESLNPITTRATGDSYQRIHNLCSYWRFITRW